MTLSNPAVAGIEPVLPAAMTGPGGGDFFHAAARSPISRTRLAAGFTALSLASRPGQCSVTIFRKSSVTCQ